MKSFPTKLATVTLLTAFLHFVSNQLFLDDNHSIPHPGSSSDLDSSVESIGSRVLSYTDNGVEGTSNIMIQHAPSQQQQHPQQHHTTTPYQFNPTPLQHKSHTQVEGLQNDGTYLLFHDEFHLGPNENCMPLVEAGDHDVVKRVHYHFYSCKKFDNQFGNRLATIYGIKMIAYAMNIPFTFTCGISPGENPIGASYLMQLNSLAANDTPGPKPHRNDGVLYSPRDICQNICGGHYCSWYYDSLDLASDAMIADWKYLSSSNVVHITDHDDAVIHLRLGDGLYSTYGVNEGKGIFPHSTYIHLLREAMKEKGQLLSIGIVTAPFKGSMLRSFDRGSTSLSEMVALDLIKALEDAFPDAKIRLHNSPDSTIIESLARVVRARKVAICGCSTFCPYALLARQTLGFMYNPVGSQNEWVRNAAKWHPEFRLFDTPMLNGLVISNNKNGYVMPEKRVVRWLREQEFGVGNVDITEGPIFRKVSE